MGRRDHNLVQHRDRRTNALTTCDFIFVWSDRDQDGVEDLLDIEVVVSGSGKPKLSIWDRSDRTIRHYDTGDKTERDETKNMRSLGLKRTLVSDRVRKRRRLSCNFGWSAGF